jgi:hypothetical protein
MTPSARWGVTPRPPSVATLGTWALGLAVALATTSHVVRHDLSPVSNRLSEHAVGAAAPLMVAAFLALAIGLAAVGVAVGRSHTRLAWPRTTAALLVGAGFAMAATALFPTSSADTATEVRHSVASGAATAAVLAAAGLQATSLVGPHRGRTPDRTAAVLGLVALLPGAASPILHESPRTGLGQRVLWTALVIWLLRVAACTRDPPGGWRAEGGSPTPRATRR